MVKSRHLEVLTRRVHIHISHMADSVENKTPQKRVSRACTFCRARKSRCDL